ncbi:VanZ family protein [Halobacillus mangrovi]|uniref:VanZ family protein n=1 Tax=Halobacillus mangrovi TaxID=402384 RepID=UPI003D9905D7
MLKKVLYTAVPLSIMVILFISSSQPYEEQDLRPTLSQYLPIETIKPFLEPIQFTYHNEKVSVETHGVDGMIEFFIRKGAHFSIYLLLMWTTFMALLQWLHKRVWKLLSIAFLITMAYAAFDEFHQSLTPNRTPYAGDVLLDGSGALTAGLGILLFYKWKNRNPSG